MSELRRGKQFSRGLRNSGISFDTVLLSRWNSCSNNTFAIRLFRVFFAEREYGRAAQNRAVFGLLAPTFEIVFFGYNLIFSYRFLLLLQFPGGSRLLSISAWSSGMTEVRKGGQFPQI